MRKLSYALLCASLVALVSRSMEHLEAAAKAINDERRLRAEMPALHGEAFPIAADVRKPDEVERAIAATVDRFGKIDIVARSFRVVVLP